ncbi:MAG: DUF3784 domain-containing protein [Oscillospiraceae bacterium]|jgi:hypothetical protein
MNGYFLAGVFLICIGVLFLFLRIEWLLAGNGPISEEERKKRGLDLNRLCKTLGWVCIVCGLALVACGVFV